MMDTTTYRAEFEKWAEEVGALPWGYLKKQRTPSGGYSVQVYQYMWQAWQAARDSMVVTLPTQDEYDDPLSAYNAISDCKKVIRTAGIRIKGESE
ncbi:hypothetical protein [Yersinia canariae]|uniref:hypothetical protein n=1 Tax=Yersinia canariae TaxID=2607663 RepID=UPI0011AADC0F|nr:hypothetical protein [Yersinia canariae]